MPNKIENGKRLLLGEFGVDSGQVIITDPCYLKHFKSDEFKLNGSEPVEKAPDFAAKNAPYSYVGCCLTTLEHPLQGGIVGLGHDGVVASTGFGDGTYQVYATFHDNRIQKLEIEFFAIDDGEEQPW